MLLGYKLQPNHPQKEHLRARHPRKWFCSSWAAFCWRCCAFHRVRCCKSFPSNLSSKWKVAGHLLTPGCSNLLRSAVALHLDIAKKVQMLAYTRIKCPGLKVGSWFQISATFAMHQMLEKIASMCTCKREKGIQINVMQTAWVQTWELAHAAVPTSSSKTCNRVFRRGLKATRAAAWWTRRNT